MKSTAENQSVGGAMLGCVAWAAGQELNVDYLPLSWEDGERDGGNSVCSVCTH
jgi:hypothetical protein